MIPVLVNMIGSGVLARDIRERFCKRSIPYCPTSTLDNSTRCRRRLQWSLMIVERDGGDLA
jgi:hypothetical protein